MRTLRPGGAPIVPPAGREMKRLLYIAFFFPPLGGAGVQRTLKFVRYLPESGWSAVVLTSQARYWMHDPSLLAEIGPDARILRAPFWGSRFLGGSRPGIAAKPQSTAPRSLGRIRIMRKAAGALLVPDAYVGWTIPAGRMARHALGAERFDALLTTSSPDSAHLLGRALKRRTGLPWIADFRDPWTRRLAYNPPTRLHDRIHRALESACLREADRVIVTSEETRRDFLERNPGLDPGKIVVITNGYDESDFAAAGELLRRERGSDAGTEVDAAGSGEIGSEPGPEPILHAGQLNPERPLAPYLAGLHRFVTRNPGRAMQARTLFLGGFYDQNVQEARRSGLEGLVRFEAGRPHVSSVAALLRARILLLLERDDDRGRLILPGKIFEYLRAGRPILAVVPRGGAADRLVRDSGAGIVADPGDPDAVSAAIGELLDRTAGRPPESADPSRYAAFERRSLARRLSEVLDSVA